MLSVTGLGLFAYSDGGYQLTHGKKMASSVHAISTDLQHVLDQPVRSTFCIIARCVLFVILRAQGSVTF